MRHIWSLLAGIIVAPLTWILVAAGQSGSTQTVTRWITNDSFHAANLIQAAVYIAVAGLLLGLLGTLRISPLGPSVAGLALITPYAVLFAQPFAVRKLVPGDWRLFGDPLPLHVPLDNGTLFLIGVLLLMATFSRQRWRRWPAPAPTQQVTADSTDDRSLHDWPPSTPEGTGSAEVNPTDPDTPAPSLGHPDSTPKLPPLPRRTTGSPWSAPPQTKADPADPTHETVH